MRYCAVIQLESSSDMARLREDVPRILDFIKGHSSSDELAFRSSDGTLFGCLFTSEKPVDMLRKKIEGSTAWRNKDSILIFDIGDCVSARGFTRQWTWMQHSAR